MNNKSVKFTMEDGFYFAYFSDGMETWKYFVPYEDILHSIITGWIEFGILPKNVKKM